LSQQPKLARRREGTLVVSKEVFEAFSGEADVFASLAETFWKKQRVGILETVLSNGVPTIRSPVFW
jgi:hypothetical protein